jgi:chorismate mutase
MTVPINVASQERLHLLRQGVCAADLALVRAFASRLKTVERIVELKLELGLPLVVPEREHYLRLWLQRATRAQAGRVSPDSVDVLHDVVLDLTKIELDEFREVDVWATNS